MALARLSKSKMLRANLGFLGANRVFAWRIALGLVGWLDIFWKGSEGGNFDI